MVGEIPQELRNIAARVHEELKNDPRQQLRGLMRMQPRPHVFQPCYICKDTNRLLMFPPRSRKYGICMDCWQQLKRDTELDIAKSNREKEE